MPQNALQQAQVGGATLRTPPSPFLGVVPADMLHTTKSLFVVPLTWLNLAPGASTSQTYQADPAWDFVAYLGNISVRSTDNQTAIDNPPLLVSLADSSGRALQPPGAAIDVATLFGTAQQPAVLTMPLVIRAGETYSFTMQNLHAATSYNVRLALCGFLSQRGGAR